MTRDIIEKMILFIKQKTPFVLATILKHSGSVPRVAGTEMLIRQNGSNFGTIGGGLLESKVIKYGVEKIKKKQTCIINIDLSPTDAENDGMVCGGRISVLLDLIEHKENMERKLNFCLKSLTEEKKNIFITIYDKNNQSYQKTSHYLVHDNSNLIDLHSLNRNEITKIKQLNHQNHSFKTLKLNDKTIIFSPVCIPKKVYILGAGHIAQPTAKIASIVGFKVIVMDDRKNFANASRFPYAEKIKIIDFKNVAQDFDKKAFIVIITRGHKYDKIVLEQALLSNAKYIGMIGSSKKRATVFKALKKEGYSTQSMKRVHSPIGIDIGSETPEEIALSIVAEMVQVRSGGSKREEISPINIKPT